jgi:putative ABC transport system permease protein
MWKDYFKIAWNSIRHRGLRTWLTLVGIFIGIAAVVALISIGQGLQGAIQQQFNDLGTDKILITSAGAFGPMDSSYPLTTNDVDAVKKVSGVNQVSYAMSRGTQLEWGRDEIEFPAITGVPIDSTFPMMAKMMSLNIEEGRTFKDTDVKKVIIGYDYAHSPDFKDKIRVGQKITIEGQQFEVIGIMKKIGSQTDDRQLTIPAKAYEEIYPDVIAYPGAPTEITEIVVQVKEGVVASDVVAPLERTLRNERDVEKGKEDFQVQTFEALIKSFLTIFNIVQTVLIGIAAISLLVGGIGIMNTMYTSVLERTSDIGIMKAIGARNSDILAMFLFESGLLGLVGGAVGVIIGLGTAKLVEIIGGAALGTGFLKAAMPWWLIV